MDAEVIVAACPFCTSMFEDGIKGTGASGEVRVLDYAEVVLDALRTPGEVLYHGAADRCRQHPARSDPSATGC